MAKIKNKINFTLAVAIVIFLISIIFFLIVLNIDSFLVLQKQEISVTVRISNYTAWNISKNETILNLGTIKKGTFAHRNIYISNDYNFPTQFILSVKGDISDLLIFDEFIYLNAKEDRDIIIYTKVIEDESYGVYSGTILIKVKKFRG